MKSQMLLDIESQWQGWHQAVELVTASAGTIRELVVGRQARFLGAGSSYYLGNVASSVWAELGLAASSVPASEPLLHPRRYPWDAHDVAIAVSRSGTTTETLEALKRAKAAGAKTIAITTVDDSLIGEVADLTFVVSAAAEQATVQTRSFSSQLMTSLCLAAQLRTPEDLGRLRSWLPNAPELIARSSGAVARLGMHWDRAYFLGTGTMVGLAQEGALKMKETALTEAEAFQTLEFRHGPKSMVDERTLVIGLLSEESEAQELKVLREVHELGAQLFLVGVAQPTDFPGVAVDVGGGVPPTLNAPLHLPALQFLAHRRAIHQGIAPEHPRNLSFAVQLDGF